MTRAAALIVAVACICGCQDQTRYVSIDMDRVVREVPSIGASPPPKVPATPGNPATATSPGLLAGDLRDPSTVAPVDLRRQIAEEQERLRKRLEERLRAVYAGQLARYERELRDEAAKDAEIDVLAMETRMYLALLELAKRRSGPMTRVALLAGYPDPGPSAPASTPPTPVEKVRADDLAKQRAAIQEADARYRADVDAIVKDLSNHARTVAESVRKRLDARRVELEAKAVSEAAAEVRSSPRELGLELTGSPSLRTPARAPVKESYAPDVSTRPPGEVTSRLDAREADVRRAAAQQWVATWMNLRHLQPRKGAPDATDEFLKWLNDPKAGP